MVSGLAIAIFLIEFPDDGIQIFEDDIVIFAAIAGADVYPSSDIYQERDDGCAAGFAGDVSTPQVAIASRACKFDHFTGRDLEVAGVIIVAIYGTEPYCSLLSGGSLDVEFDAGMIVDHMVFIHEVEATMRAFDGESNFFCHSFDF